MTGIPGITTSAGRADREKEPRPTEEVINRIGRDIEQRAANNLWDAWCILSNPRPRAVPKKQDAQPGKKVPGDETKQLPERVPVRTEPPTPRVRKVARAVAETGLNLLISKLLKIPVSLRLPGGGNKGENKVLEGTWTEVTDKK